MKKKNLIILLLLPFIISLLGVITVRSSLKQIKTDLTSISWNYQDTEVFKINDEGHLLEAKGIYPEGTTLLEGNELVWSVKNKYEDEELHAKVITKDGKSYLQALTEGEVYITCQNKKGNVSRQMEAITYLNGVLVISPKSQGSQNNIDSTIYYGEKDIINGGLTNAKVELELRCIPSSVRDSVSFETSSNVTLDEENLTLTINAPGDAFIKAETSYTDLAKPSTFKFNIVEEGVNVYSYSDLLYCTNESTYGEKVVLRKNFESLENTYLLDSTGNLILRDKKPVLKSNNTCLFGNYNLETKTYNFKNEIVKIESKYNTEYIKQWNQFAKANKAKGYKELATTINAGLNVKKDFYGNGFTINLHNLTYPYLTQEKVDSEGNTFIVPYLSQDNLFRGPNSFYTLGDPHNVPLITAYGQDNVGMYVSGRGVTVNDVYLKNCDFGNSFENLDYTGTVLEIDNDDVTIKNSRILNGKQVVRAFSTNNLVIDNCMLSNARTFLLMLGTNEYIKVDENNTINDLSLNDYFKPKDSIGDSLLNTYLQGTFSSKSEMRNSLEIMQEALSNNLTTLDYKASVNVNNTLFYRSGVSCIAFESLFDGPFLFSASPSIITDVFGMLTSSEGRPIIPYTPLNVSGISYPVDLSISGKTKFYDYKAYDEFDLGGLINENISKIASEVFGKDKEITIDDIFPLKKMLFDYTNKSNITYKNKINVPIAYYGGGTNLSTVRFTESTEEARYTSIFDVDWLDTYLNLPGNEDVFKVVRNVMLKSVTVVTGFNPFKFVCVNDDGYLFNESPSVDELKNNAKGE